MRFLLMVLALSVSLAAQPAKDARPPVAPGGFVDPARMGDQSGELFFMEIGSVIVAILTIVGAIVVIRDVGRIKDESVKQTELLEKLVNR